VGASTKALPAVERAWRICDSQDQVLAVAFRYKGTSLIRNSPPP